jgi:hypothetical protein
MELYFSELDIPTITVCRLYPLNYGGTVHWYITLV